MHMENRGCSAKLERKMRIEEKIIHKNVLPSIKIDQGRVRGRKYVREIRPFGNHD